MKKSTLLTSLLVSLIAFYLLYGSGNEESQTFSLPISSKKEFLVNKKKKLYQGLKHTKYVPPRDVTPLSSFPKLCQESLTNLGVMTVSDYQELIETKESFSNFFGEDCLKDLQESALFKKIKANSNCSLLDDKGESSPECLSLLLMLKAHFISEYTKGKLPSEMSGPELAANFIKMFSEIESLNKEKFSTNIELINTLQALYPDNLDILEPYLGYLMIGKQVTQTDGIDEILNTRLDEALGQSFRIDRLLAVKDLLSQDFEKAEATLNKLHEHYPHEPDIAYYQAAVYWKRGNKEQAVEYLNKALSLSVGCTGCTPGVYRTTKEKLSRMKPGESNPFAISFGLNFDNI